MAFCSNCGHQLADGAKFCFECGTPVAVINTTPNEQRKTVYDGTVHKCPQCNEVLDSFVTVCPSCGYELRGTTATSAVKEFSTKLNNAASDKQKANIIRSFPIPNTKEDIFEFMILASSNIDEHPSKDIFNAWIAKFEQCYSKAKLSFKQDSDFNKIHSIYEETLQEIRRIKRKGPTRKLLKIFIPIISVIVVNVIFWSWIASGYNNEEEEVARLEAIVVEVETALANKEYDLAMMHAKSIDYSAWKSNDELERQWDIKQDYLIKEIIATAAEEGIVMEYPTDTADEKDKQNTNNQSSSQDYQQNIDDFNEQMGNVQNQWKSMWGEDPAEETTASVPTSSNEYIATGKHVIVENFSFDIPTYWNEEGSKTDYRQYYAEKGDACVMLSIGYPRESDDDYDVTFEGLYADNENMIDAIAAMFTDSKVIDHEVFESDHGVKGILYQFSCHQKIDWLTSVDAEGYCFCFPSEDDRRWFLSITSKLITPLKITTKKITWN